MTDTIYALSSGRLPAAIAVIRLSGPNARAALQVLAGKVPEPRRAAYAKFTDPDSRETLDDGLAIWIPGPRSETGEDMAELHVHGGRAVVAALFRALGTLDGLRPAEAGEFTRRALLNGKLDLTAVEGLGDLIAAETEAQRRQAVLQFRGGLSRQVEAWRARLLALLARIEATIDFSDEGDVPGDLLHAARSAAAELLAEIRPALASAARGERLRDGFTVAIAGPPNVGKSTLLNRLAQRDVAIVSDIPGTTRDALEVALDLRGVPVVLVDTAGIRDTSDPVEAEGVKRARARAAAADLVLWLVDDDRQRAPRDPEHGREWVVRAKADLMAAKPPPGQLAVSGRTGAGIDALVTKLAEAAGALAGEPALVTHARQRRALEAVAEHLAALSKPEIAGREELLAEELRQAANALARITGRIGVEDVLGEIFKNFCIGK
jgi:tRNA modification GTPase